MIEVDDKKVKLTVWDDSFGRDHSNKTLSPAFLKNAHGIFVFYDVTNRDSFTSVRLWMDQIEQSAFPYSICLLVGNKTDLKDQRVVSTEEGQELADHYCISFMETSAKDSTNVEEAVELFTHEFVSRPWVHDIPKM